MDRENTQLTTRAMMKNLKKQVQLQKSRKLPVKKYLVKAEELNDLERAHLHEFARSARPTKRIRQGPLNRWLRPQS